MAIETLEDLNAQACCCDLPLCPVPEMECASWEVDLLLCGTGAVTPSAFVPWTTPACQFTQAVYRTVTVDSHQSRSDQGSITYQTVITHFRSASNTCTYSSVDTDDGGTDPGDFGITFDPEVKSYGSTSDTYYFDYVRTGSSGGGATWDEGYRLTYSDKVTDPLGDLITEADSLIAAAIADPEISMSGLSVGYSCTSETAILDSTACAGIDPAEPRAMRRRKAKARFKIPAEWLDPTTEALAAFPGTYFKFTYDVLEELDDGGPSIILADQVLEWTGPGTGEPEDPSWYSGWITLDPPATAGTRRIVNIRFVCRENWYIGEVPQVTGEAYPPAE